MEVFEKLLPEGGGHRTHVRNEYLITKITYAIGYLGYSQPIRTIKCKGYHQPPLSLPIETKKDEKLRCH